MYGLSLEHSTEECLLMHAFCSMGAGGGQDRDGQGSGPALQIPAPVPACQTVHTDMTGDCQNAPQTMWLMYRDPLQRSSNTSEKSQEIPKSTRSPRKGTALGKFDLLPPLIPFSRESRQSGGTRRKKDWTLALSWNSL